jgi:glycosyltransferase involved in cell wall biosynthesis
MNTKHLRIVVSHPRKQHVYELLKTFIQDPYTFRFYTTFWTPSFLINSIPILLPKKYASKIIKVLNKRRDATIPTSSVYIFPSLEILRFISGKIRIGNFPNKAVFYLDKMFDRYVAKKIKQNPPDIFIGYEMTSYHSFNAAKEMGCITILDLAQIHYKKIDTLASQYECLNYIKKDTTLFTKLNSVKQHEYDLADYIFALSNFAKESLLEQNIPINKIKQIHLGVNIEIFTPRTFYNTVGIFRIIFTGTLFARKGIQLILDALTQLNIPDIELLVVGATHGNSNVLHATTYPFKIRHIPYASHAELNNIYKTADIFILPSYLDSFGMVVTEAMATGMPVIVSCNTGAADFVQQGGGKVIAIDSVEEIKTSILYYYTDRSRVQLDGLKAAEISRQYTWDYYRTCVAKTIEEVFQKNDK